METQDTGDTYFSQVPSLGFAASHELVWRSDNDFAWIRHSSGGVWVDLAEVPSDDVAVSEYVVAFRVPLAAIDSQHTSIKFVMAMIDTEAGNEKTYAGVPFNTFLDGFDPDFETYYDFSLEGGALPIESAIY